MSENSTPPDQVPHYTTAEVAKLLGMAVRSVQLMVDRGDLEAWKTPGGHRRITRASVERWRGRQGDAATTSGAPAAAPAPAPAQAGTGPRVLLIEEIGRASCRERV